MQHWRTQLLLWITLGPPHSLNCLLQAAILIWVKPEWKIADPLCTFVFAILVLLTTRGMVRDILDIVMERVPRGLDIEHLAGGTSFFCWHQEWGVHTKSLCRLLPALASILCMFIPWRH